MLALVLLVALPLCASLLENTAWAAAADANTRFVHRAPTLWEEHEGLMLGALLLFFAQSVTIAALVMSRRDRIAAERLLQKNEARYRSRLDEALEHKRQYEEGLERLLELNRRAGQMTERQICDFAIEIAVETTQSEIGYLHLFSDDKKTVSLTIWNAETLKQCAGAHDSRPSLDPAGMLASYVQARRPMVEQDATEPPHDAQCGAGGQLNMLRHISTEVRDGDLARMIVGVGNKAGEYIEEDSQQLQLIANEVQKIVMRRRAEEALNESEARFRFIADCSPGMSWVADKNNRCVWFNKTWLDFAGRSMERELDGRWMESVHPDDLDAGAALSAAHFARRLPYAMEFRVRRHDGQYRWMLDTAQPRFDDDGQFLGYVGARLDITERKQAELEREQFLAFFSLSQDMMCIAGADGYFKKVNPTFSKVLGFAEEELLGRPYIDFVVAEDRPKTLLELNDLVQTSRTLAFENRYRCKDGTVRLLSWQAVWDGKHQVTYATARDVTGQREAEEQLNKLWLAVEQTSHSIVITGRNGCIEYVNRAFSTISGYAPEEVIGQNPRILQSGRTPAATYEQMWRTLENGDIWQGEFHNRHKSGEIRIESVRISPVRQPDGAITHYLAIKEDVTEHQRAADAFCESKALLQRVIDSTPDWIHVKDREHRFLLVNQSFAAAFAQTPESMMGRRDTDFMQVNVPNRHAGNGMRNLHDDDDAVFGGQTIHDPYDKIVFEHGAYRVFDTFKGPLRDAAQGVNAVLCYQRDITERFNTEQEQKALETQLRQAQKMEIIGHLTGGIAHDFNNILAAMFGYAELIEMAVDGQNPQLSEYVKEILQAGTRAKELVAQLLTFSHRRDMATEAIAVAPIIKEVAQLLRSTMPTSISISTPMAADLPEVQVSAVQLHQILMNLGINARDAITGKGAVEIRAEERVLDELNACASCHQNFSGRYLVISVRDTGAGIAKQNLTKIFDPFFTTKEVGRGSGLGLSVLHGIVHSAKGHIGVSTALGDGTQFRICLPAQARQPGRLSHDLDRAAQNAALCGHVMVVDDEAGIVGFMTALLENFGCKVTGLTSSTEALRLFQQDPHGVDMVITDQTMPDLTGAELARAMLACRPDMPIVLCTGYSNTVDEEGARQIGIRRFLVKPVPAHVLADLVAEFIALKEELDQFDG